MELRRLKGELGSLGGLLKQAVAAGADKERINPVLRSLDKAIFSLQALIRRI
jgi:hypothetical protein